MQGDREWSGTGYRRQVRKNRRSNGQPQNKDGTGHMEDRREENGQLHTRGIPAGNAGYSLAELLIAVTILAIVSIPLLHVFATSARINVKSRQTLRSTTVAQNIMEGLKAYTLEEVQAQFEPPEEYTGNSYYAPEDRFYIIDSNLIQGGIRDLTKEMPGYTEGDEVYYFGIENVKMQGAEYDALIRLDASTYGAGSKESSGDSGALHDNEFNGSFYAQMGSVAEVDGGSDDSLKALDSSYHQDKDLEKDVLTDIKRRIEDYTLEYGGTLPDDFEELTLEDVIKKRLIKVTIEDARTEDVQGNGQCRATVTFAYEFEYAGMENVCTKPECPYKKGTQGHMAAHSHGYAGSMGGEVCAISRTFSSGNFYLFYYPFYDTSRRIDYIEFEVKDKDTLLNEERPLLKSIVLAKQIRSDIDASLNVIVPELSEAELWAKESSYKAEVNINTYGAIGNDLIYRTNLGTNMSDKSEVSMGNVNQFFDDMMHVIPCSFAGDNVGDKVTSVIYDIEIGVYQTGAAKHFTEDNFEDNDEVRRLAVITSLDGTD